MTEKKTTQKKIQPEKKPGVDFGVLDFSPVGAPELTTSQDLVSQVVQDNQAFGLYDNGPYYISASGVGMGKSIVRVDAFNVSGLTASREGVDGVWGIVIREGERVAIPVSLPLNAVGVKGNVSLAFEKGLVFLGYEQGTVFLANIGKNRVFLDQETILGEILYS